MKEKNNKRQRDEDENASSTYRNIFTDFSKNNSKQEESTSLIDQFKNALLDLNFKKAEEIVKNSEFDVNQSVKYQKVDGNKVKDVEVTPLHMILDLDFEEGALGTFSTEGKKKAHEMNLDVLDEELSQVVMALIERGANINAIDSNGNTPLHNSVLASHLPSTKMLVDKDADLSIINRDNYSILDCVLQAAHPAEKFVDLILKKNTHLKITETNIDDAEDVEDELGFKLAFYLLQQNKEKDETILKLNQELAALRSKQDNMIIESTLSM